MNVPCLVITNASASSVLAESEKAADIIQQLASQSGDLKILKKCVNFTLMITHRKPIVSCFVFNLNWKTVFMMLASVFNYTIIIIQFYDGSYK